MKKLYTYDVDISGNFTEEILTLEKPKSYPSVFVGYVLEKEDYIKLKHSILMLKICISESKFYKDSADEKFMNEIQEILDNDIAD